MILWSLVWGYWHKFPQTLIFTWKLAICSWQQVLSVVFLEVTGWLCLFSRKCLPKDHFVCVFYARRSSHRVMHYHSAFCVLLTLWPETCERVCTQGRRCNTDYSCYCSIKDIHRLNSVTVRVWRWVSQQLLVICWCHCLGLCWNTGSFALCQYKCQRHEKGHVSLIKIALFSGHPHRACFENCYYIHALFTNHGLTAVAF